MKKWLCLSIEYFYFKQKAQRVRNINWDINIGVMYIRIPRYIRGNISNIGELIRRTARSTCHIVSLLSLLSRRSVLHFSEIHNHRSTSKRDCATNCRNCTVLQRNAIRMRQRESIKRCNAGRNSGNIDGAGK